MHVHTHYSRDGRDSPRAMVCAASKAGLAGIAITDHNTQDGIREAVEAGEEFGVEVIPGIEVSCLEGHVLLYGSPSFDLPGERTVSGVIQAARSSMPGCLVAVAHPFDLHRSGMGWKAKDYDFDAVETVNSRSLVPRSMVLPLCREMDVGEIGGSDAHSVHAVGKGRTIVSSRSGNLLERMESSARVRGGLDAISLFVPMMERMVGDGRIRG